jgi:hypothetical protein
VCENVERCNQETLNARKGGSGKQCTPKSVLLTRELLQKLKIHQVVRNKSSKAVRMIRVICDTCGVVRNPRQQEWILGYDLRVDTPQTVSRSISFFDRWDDSRILQRGAIHFCSLE